MLSKITKHLYTDRKQIRTIKYSSLSNFIGKDTKGLIIYYHSGLYDFHECSEEEFEEIMSNFTN